MGEKNQKVAVWDLFVRVFHWTLVASMIGMYITGEHDKALHARLGYFIIGLVLARIVWGIIGTEHAKFKNFWYRPRTQYQYLSGLIRNNPKHYLGHNPVGGAMIFIILFTLLVTAFAGLKALGQEGRGPFAHSGSYLVPVAYADKDKHEDDDQYENRTKGTKTHGNEFWEDVHEAMTNILIILIIMHICGVVVSSWIHKENLILGMITGKKQVG